MPDKSFAALGSLIVRYWPRFAFSTALRVAASALITLQPFLLAQFVTSIDDKDRALRYLIALFAANAGHMVLWTVCDYYISLRVNPLVYEFKRTAFDTVWAKDYRTFVDLPSGKIASYVNDQRAQVTALWESAHFGFLPVLTALPIYGVLLVGTSAANVVTYGLFLAVAAVVMAYVSRPVKRRQRTLTNNNATNSGRVFDSYANFVNVFSFRSQRKEKARNDAQLDGLIGDSIRFDLALTSYWGVASLLVRGLLWGTVLGYSWYEFDRGAISFAALVVSVSVLMDFTWNYWGVVHNFGVWIDNSAAYREAYNYLFPGQNIMAQRDRDAIGAAGPAVPAADAAAPVGSLPMTESLEVRGVSFAYPDDPERVVLDNISFRLMKGEKLGVIGRSGEGKSTLIKILLGFYPPTSGEILVDGEPVTPERLNRVQSYVPQDTSLFQESISYNIAYADHGDPSAEAVRAAAVKANIDTFIETLPSGYDTLVGERGIKLSLGQRQRIAIARAFLKPADLLILDEATSALDTQTEAFVQEALEALWADKSAIIIAHRTATLQNVDRVIELTDGRISNATLGR